MENGHNFNHRKHINKDDLGEISLTCGLFLPFSSNFSFVRKKIEETINSIKSTKESNEELEKKRIGKSIDINIEIADNEYTSDKSKIVQITYLLENSDFAIFDITEARPNVIWELGYYQANRGRAILIKRYNDTAEVPFNIMDREVIKYEFSEDGLDFLASKLKRHILQIAEKVHSQKQTLLYDHEIKGYLSNLREGLAKIDGDSLLKNLAKGEFMRLDRRIKSLQDGKMDLRNEKPLEEIIGHFTAYVEQLADGYEFDTITYPPFWRDITENGKNFDYFYANISAITRGTIIKRIFVATEKELKEDKTLIKVILKHYDFINEGSSESKKLEVRIYIVDDYREMMDEYPDIALWYKKNEQQLLIYPKYIDRDNKKIMTKTDFYYFKESSDMDFHTNKNEIKRKTELFEGLWKKKDCKKIEEIYEKIGPSLK